MKPSSSPGKTLLNGPNACIQYLQFPVPLQPTRIPRMPFLAAAPVVVETEVGTFKLITVSCKKK